MTRSLLPGGALPLRLLPLRLLPLRLLPLRLLPLLTLLASCLLPAASAGWAGEDARADAANPLANAWADLVVGTVDGEAVRIEVASRSAAAFGTAFVALYEVAGEMRFCAAMEDRALLGYTGIWDAAAQAPADARAAKARHAADGTAAYEILDCMDATGAVAAKFLAVDAKPTPLGLAGVVLDEMAASAVVGEAPVADAPLGPSATPEDAPADVEGAPRAVPLASPALALAALAAVAAVAPLASGARPRLPPRGRA